MTEYWVRVLAFLAFVVGPLVLVYVAARDIDDGDDR